MIWGPNVEVVLRHNAASLVTTPIEVFLIKVMRRAMNELDPVADAVLLRDMDLFNKQEGQHFKTHANFNRLSREWCEEIPPLEAAFERDLDGFLETQSLQWLVGYCEGFEAAGGSVSSEWVDGHNAEKAGIFDSVVVDMFRWHLAEEYEHRDVMWRVYRRLYGTAEAAHDLRVEMFRFAPGHFGGYVLRMFQALLATYRKELSQEEVRASQQREEKLLVETRQTFERLTAPVLTFDYDPTTTPPPAQLQNVLSAYSTSRRS